MASRGAGSKRAPFLWLLPLLALAVSGCGESHEPPAAAGAATPVPIRVALASVKQGADLPQLVAARSLEESGYRVQFLELNGNYQGIQAVVSGRTEFGELSALSVIIAIDQGAPLKILLWEARLDNVLAARPEIRSLQDLDGKRVGVFATVSNAGLALGSSLRQVPGVQPRVLTGSFSSARVAALLAGEMDAAVIQYPDWLHLRTGSGEGFHLLADYAREELLSRVVFARTDFLEANPQLAYDYLLASVEAARRLIGSGEELVKQQLREHLPEIDPAILDELSRFYVQREVWPVDGGRSELDRALRTTLAVGAESELLTGGGEPASYLDCRFLNRMPPPEGASPTPCG